MLTPHEYELEEICLDAPSKPFDSKEVVKRSAKSSPRKDERPLSSLKEGSPIVSRVPTPRRVNLKTSPSSLNPLPNISLSPPNPSSNPLPNNDKMQDVTSKGLDGLDEPYYIKGLKSFCKLEYVVVIPLVCCLLGFSMFICSILIIVVSHKDPSNKTEVMGVMKVM